VKSFTIGQLCSLLDTSGYPVVGDTVTCICLQAVGVADGRAGHEPSRSTPEIKVWLLFGRREKHVACRSRNLPCTHQNVYICTCLPVTHKLCLALMRCRLSRVVWRCGKS
jgi:hypothetical protein